MSDELITWLHAQLDDDERVARATRFRSWQAERSEHSVYASESSVVRPEDEGARDYEYIVPPDSEGSEGIDPAAAEHIARWDPARVLAEIEAKRKLLDMADAAQAEPTSPVGYIRGNARGIAQGLDQAVRVLAQAYAGREGWRAEWLLDERRQG